MVQLTSMNFLWGSGGKESAYNVGDLGSIHGLGRSPREGKGYLLQYSGLENVMDLYSPWGHKESGMTEWLSLSHPYMTTGKTIELTIQIFVSNVMSLLFSMLSRFVIAFLPRIKSLLISWLQSPSAVILEPQKKPLAQFSLFPHLFAMKWWDWMPWS